MAPEQWHKIASLFQRALERPEAERAAFLAGACGDDTALRREVESLLSADETAEQRLGALPAAVAADWLLDVAPPADGADAEAPLAAGTVLAGHYRVEARLGGGGMGVVYLARDARLGRCLALKLLPPELARDRERVLRFEQEARAASALNHPSICVVYELGRTDDGRPFIAMEHVEGETLRERLASGPLPLEEAISAVRQAAEALEVAHRAGIVHRDVKPENLMLREDGYLKVLDFGLAKLVEGRGGESTAPTVQTASGVVVGTVCYMSPEQARRQPVDARTDVWALGAVLYELVCGAAPFAGETNADVLAAVLRAEPEPLSARRAGVPPELERIVHRALHKVADERLASAGELARELKELEKALEVGPSGAANQRGVTARPTLRAARARTGGGQAGRHTNLPRRVSPLVGRERELEEVTAALRAADTRLLTMTGPGGVGKTRLAVEAARQLLERFPDGVFAVDLSPLADPELMIPHIAQALDVREAPGTAVRERLERFLAEKRLLLVLDNFEHLVEAAPFVAGLLEAAPNLTVLVTSRALLRLREEHEYAVEPLELPTLSGDAMVEELERTPAVALFVARAREARPAFALTADNAATVAEICRRLDGLPLAIELAAARLRVLGPESLLGRLEHQLKLLVGGARDLPARQQTMRAAVAWSYELLDEAEQKLLRWLAVFVGGATLEAAEAACGPGELEVLDGLGSLVEKSLLRRREGEGEDVRFVMLEVVREYALEQLEACGEREAAALAHARYFLMLAEEAEPQLRGEEQREWTERLGREVENLRAALALLLKVEPEKGARLVAALFLFWIHRSLYSEAKRWAERTLSAGTADPKVRVRLLQVLSFMEWRLGESKASGEHARAAVEASREAGDALMLVKSLNALGISCYGERDLRRARETFEEALAIACDLGVRESIAVLLTNLALVARNEGDYRKARSYCERALDTTGRHLRVSGNGLNLLHQGWLSLEEGDPARSRALLLEALSIYAELGDTFYCANALDGLAAVALAAGERERAARLVSAAEALYETVGAPLDPWEQSLRDRTVAALREELEPDALEREWARGRGMGLEQAVREALGQIED
jgi:predicted ATPase